MPRNVKEIPSFVYDPNCVLYVPLWKRDAKDGDSFISDDATGHLCTVTGATWGIQGRTFDGNDDKIVVGTASTDSILNLLDNFTLMTWLNPVALPVDDPTSMTLICRGDYTVEGYWWKLNKGAGAPAQMWFSTHQGGAVQTNVSADGLIATAGIWYMLGVTYAGGTATFYLNGATSGAGGGMTNPLTSDNQLEIGFHNAFGNNYCMNGKEGEVLGYNRVLTAAEIQQIYLATKFRYQ